MGRPLARGPNGQLHTYDPELKRWRALSAEEHGELTPRGVLDEQGVTGGERFLIKNLSPSTALAMLRLKGYEAFQYGDGLNFAVRKSEQEPWRLVDPAKGGLPEVWADLTDLFGDIGVAGATALGTAAGGGFASIATGAASGAAAEFARQNLARAAGGLPPGVDLPEIAGSAIGGGIAPPVGALAGKAARGIAGGIARIARPGGAISQAGEGLVSKITGIKGAKGIEVSDVLLERAATLPAPIITPDDGVKIFRLHLDDVAGPAIESKTQALEAAVPVRATVDMSRFARNLRGIVDIVEPSGRTVSLDSPLTVRLQKRLADLLRFPSKSQIAASLGPSATPQQVGSAFKRAVQDWRRGLSRMPARQALRLKRLIQTEVSELRGFKATGAVTPGAATPPTDRDVRLLRNLAGKIRKTFHRQLRQQGHPLVERLDSDLSDFIRARNGFRKFFGERGLGEADTAVSNLRKAHGPNGEHVLRAIREYDRQFPGLGFTPSSRILTTGKVFPGNAESLARQIAIGLDISKSVTSPEEFGIPGLFGRFTATGGIFGASILGGAVGGAGGGLVGGKEGAVAGSLAGLAAPFAFSPAAIVRLAPHTARLNAFVSQMATGVDKVLATKMLRESVALLGKGAAQETGRRVASQDAKGRRRAVFDGR